MKKATEQAPFLLVTALYLIIVAVGAGIDSPPLAVNSLLVVGLTIAVFHHLLNVYTVAGLVDSYPRWPFVLDLAAIGVLAMMFTILAHPLVGDYGTLRPPLHWPPAFLDGGEQARYLRQIVGDEPRITAAQALEMFRRSMYRFFCLGVVLWVLLFAWHSVVIATEKKHIHLKKPWVHAISFVAYGALILGGWLLTRETPLPVEVWTARMTLLNVFSAIAVATAAVMLWVEYARGAKYEAAPQPGN